MLKKKKKYIYIYSEFFLIKFQSIQSQWFIPLIWGEISSLLGRRITISDDTSKALNSTPVFKKQTTNPPTSQKASFLGRTFCAHSQWNKGAIPLHVWEVQPLIKSRYHHNIGKNPALKGPLSLDQILDSLTDEILGSLTDAVCPSVSSHLVFKRQKS